LKVFTNLAISLDGKIADLKFPGKPLGTTHDRKTMQHLRAKCDAIVLGAKTLRAEPDPMRFKGKKKQPVNVIVSGSGNLPARCKFWNHEDAVRLVFTTKAGYKKAFQAAKDRALIYVVGAKTVSMKKVFQQLKKCGLKNILVEGGGELMASCLKENLIHELNITLCPWIIGGRGNPTLVGGDRALIPWKSLKLDRVRKVKNELYLKYKVKKG